MNPSGLWFWLIIFGPLFVAFAAPILIALARQADGIGMVIVVSTLGLLTLMALPLAWWLAFTLPRRLPPLDHASRRRSRHV